MAEWKTCDVCGGSPCVSECDHCLARYCSEECKGKDATERKDVGAEFPLASHSDYCPKLYDEEAPRIRDLFSHDPFPLKLFGTAWHALPGPVPGDIPHAFAKKGDPHYKPLLHAWLKVLMNSKQKRSVSYFVADEDATRVMVFRLSQVQSDEILKLWEEKK